MKLPAVRHIVLANLKDDAAENIEALREGVEMLQYKIPGILNITSGPASLVSGGHAYNWALICTFRDKKSADAYKAHEDHMRLLDDLLAPFLSPTQASLCVLEFVEAQEKERGWASLLESTAVAVITGSLVARLMLRSKL